MVAGLFSAGALGCATSRPHAAPGVPRSSRGLEARLITDPPAGFKVQPDTVGDTGPSDLAKAVRDDGESDAKHALVSEGFVRGYQRLWQNRSGEQIVVFLYQFASAGGAQAGYARWVSFEQPSGSDSTIFYPGGLPKGESVGLSGQSQGQTGAVVLYAAGPFTVQIDVNSTGAEQDARELAAQIAVKQLGRL